MYEIVRLYEDDRCCLRRRVIKRGLTLRQAVAHCEGTESVYLTARKAAAKARTKRLGAWVDTYRRTQ